MPPTRRPATSNDTMLLAAPATTTPPSKRPPAHRSPRRHEPLHLLSLPYSSVYGPTVESCLSAWEPDRRNALLKSEFSFLVCRAECPHPTPLHPERLASAISEFGSTLFGDANELAIEVGRGRPPPPTVVVTGPAHQLAHLASHVLASNRACIFSIEGDNVPSFNYVATIAFHHLRDLTEVRQEIQNSIIASQPIAAFARTHHDGIPFIEELGGINRTLNEDLLLYISASISLEPRPTRHPACLPSFNLFCHFPCLDDENQANFRHLMTTIMGHDALVLPPCIICGGRDHSKDSCPTALHSDWPGARYGRPTDPAQHGTAPLTQPASLQPTHAPLYPPRYFTEPGI